MKPREFKHKKTGCIAKELNIPTMHRYRVEADNYNYTLPAKIIENCSEWEEVIKKDYEILDWKEYLKSNDEIISVKRLSDGEVFSVGDKDKDGDKIKGFWEKNDKIMVLFEPSAWQYLESTQKSRKSILITEDGTELFEGDRSFIMYEDMQSIWNYIISKDNNKKLLYFSTHKAAEEYRLRHYKGLSLDDIDNQIDVSEKDYEWLENLIKSRL